MLIAIKIKILCEMKIKIIFLIIVMNIRAILRRSTLKRYIRAGIYFVSLCLKIVQYHRERYTLIAKKKRFGDIFLKYFCVMLGFHKQKK